MNKNEKNQTTSEPDFLSEQLTEVELLLSRRKKRRKTGW